MGGVIAMPHVMHTVTHPQTGLKNATLPMCGISTRFATRDGGRHTFWPSSTETSEAFLILSFACMDRHTCRITWSFSPLTYLGGFFIYSHADRWKVSAMTSVNYNMPKVLFSVFTTRIGALDDCMPRYFSDGDRSRVSRMIILFFSSLWPHQLFPSYCGLYRVQKMYVCEIDMYCEIYDRRETS